MTNKVRSNGNCIWASWASGWAAWREVLEPVGVPAIDINRLKPHRRHVPVEEKGDFGEPFAQPMRR